MKHTFTPGQRLSIAGAGDFFRLLSTTSPVDVEFYFQGREIAERLEVEAGFAESFRTIEFDRVDITSPLAQTVQFETARGSEIRYDRGAATISGSVDLNAATLAALETINVRPEAQSGFYAQKGALAANTAEQIVAPSSNTGGLVVLQAEMVNYATGATVIIAKSSAPTSITDGEIVMVTRPTYSSAANAGSMPIPQLIDAGKGLYVISAANITADVMNIRSCRYKLL